MKEVPRTATYCLMLITVGLIGGSLGPSLIYLSALVDATVAEISVVFTAKALGNILGAFIAGRVFDRVKGHYYLIIMLLIVAASLFVMPFSGSLVILLVVFFVMGFAEVSVNIGSNLMTIWLHKGKAGSAVSLLHFCYSIGTMVAPLVLIAGGYLGGDYGTGYWIIALYTLIFPFVIWFQPSPKYSVSTKDEHSKTFNKAFFICFLVMVFFYVGFEISIAGWISTYAALNGIEQTKASVLVTWFFLAFACGRLISVPILRWFALSHIMIVLLATTVLGSVLMSFESVSMTLTALLLGAGCSAIFPMLFTFSNQVMALTGKLTGYVFTCCGFGAMVIPSLTGPLINAFGAQIYPYILISMSFIMLLLWFGLRKLAAGDKQDALLQE